MLLIKLCTSDLSTFNIVAKVKLFIMLMDSISLKQGSQSGFIICVDVEKLLMAHVFKIPIFSTKHFLYYLQEAMPIRIKKILFFNCSSVAEKLVALCNPFIAKHFWELIGLHKTIDPIFEFIAAETLPTDYPNGEADPMEKYHRKVFSFLLQTKII